MYFWHMAVPKHRRAFRLKLRGSSLGSRLGAQDPSFVHTSGPLDAAVLPSNDGFR